MTDTVRDFISEDMFNKTNVCANGTLYFLLSANAGTWIDQNAPGWEGMDGPFIELPGGTNDVLDGTAFGGVTLSDIVISSYQGFQLNGYENGYQMPNLSRFVDGVGTEGDFVLENGIQTPGFFSIPICTNMFNTLMTIANEDTTEANYPCNRRTIN